MPTVSFQAPTDYSAELEAIARRRKYAEALQQQGMQPVGETETVGGWAIPRSPLEGLAKALQQGLGSYKQSQLDKEQRDVAKRYQDDLVRVLSEGNRLSTGTPAQPPATPNDDEGNPMPGVAARAADPNAAAALYMTHPATQALGMQEMQRQRMMQAFGLGGASSGSPAQTGDTQQTGATSPPSQNGVGGVPRNVAMALLLADPSGKLLAQEQAKYSLQANKPVPVTEGGALVGPDGRLIYARPKLGENVLPIYDDKGNVIGVRPMPGAAEAAAGQTSAVEGAKAQFDTVEIPVSDGSKRTVPRAQVPQILGGKQPPQPAPQAEPQRPPQEQAALDQALAQMRANPGAPVTVNVPPSAPVATGAVVGRSPTPQQTAQQQSYGRERGEQEAGRAQAAMAARTTLANMDRLNNVAKELEAHPGLSGITGKVNQYPMLDVLPETRAARALQQTLVRQSAVSTLQAMRDSSKTGGAVGNVTEKEWPILEQQLAALDAAQSTADYKVALRNLQNQMNGAMSRIRGAYRETYGDEVSFEAPKYETQGRSQSSDVRSRADAILKGQ